MRITNRKWWLTLMALLFLLPAASAKPEKSHQQHRQVLDVAALTVAEGGSSLVYVLGAGVACVGAMLVRSRSAKPKES